MDTIYSRPISLGNESVEQAAAAAVGATAVWPWPADHLVTADTLIKFAVVTLEKQSSELARMLAAAIRARVAERRNNCAGTLLYLSNPNVTAIDDTFNMPKNATIRHVIQTLLLRLDHSDHSESASATLKAPILQLCRQQMEMLIKVARSLSLKEQLKELLKESPSTTKTVQQGQPSDVEKTMTSAIKAEMQLFANTGVWQLRALPGEGLQLSDVNSGNVLLGCWCLVHKATFYTE